MDFMEKELNDLKLVKTLMSHTPMIFYVIDKKGIFQLSEGLGLKGLGLKPGQVVGLSVKDIYKDDIKMLSSINRAFLGESITMFSQVGAIYFESYLIPYFDDHNEVDGIIGVAIDVSERKQTELELEETRVFQEALINSVPGLLYMFNAKSEMIFWNEKFRNISGYNDEELKNFKLKNWFEDDAKIQESIRQQLEIMSNDGTSHLTENFKLKDGTLVPTYFSSSVLNVDGEDGFVGIGIDVSPRIKAEEELKELNRTLEEKVEDRTKELREANMTLELTNVEIINKNDELNALNEELTAMNEEINAINQQLNENNKKMIEMQKYLVEAEKMASLGTLVAGVAHEVNTPIGVSITAATHLSDIAKEIINKKSLNKPIKEDMDFFFEDLQLATDIIEKNLSRAGALVQSFKQLSVDQSNEDKRVFDLGEYLDEIIQSLSPSYRKLHIKVKKDYKKGITINGWPGAFAQIITNLLFNSIYHGFNKSESGTVNISASKEGNEIIIVFTDDGKGMSEDVLTKIFDPFFTTKRLIGGTGLGLSIVYSLVTQKFKGTISCDSEPGIGTSFTIVLPVGGDLDVKE